MEVTITTENFEQYKNGDLPLVVDIWATWCGPCRMIGPALEEIATELNGKVKIVKMTVDENQQVPAQFGIRSIPTLLIFKNGEVVNQLVGALPKEKIAEQLNRAL